MKLSNLIFSSGDNDERKLRIWIRLIIFILGSIFIFFAFEALSVDVADILQLPETSSGNIYSFTPRTVVIQTISTSTICLGLFIFSIVLRKYVDKLSSPMKSIGFGFRNSILHYIIGFVGGGVLIFFILIILLVSGNVSIEYTGTLFSEPIYFIYLTLFIAGTAFIEELLLRGYPVKILDETIPRVYAIAFPAVLFGVAHLLNPNATVLSIINISIGGVLFGLLYLKFNSIWLPAGLHFGWNYFAGPILGINQTIVETYPAFLRITMRGSSIITGGNCSPEGSVFATVALTIAIIVVVMISKSKQ